MLFIGIVHFFEDTYSSYLGLQILTELFGLTPASWEITYWTMSVAAQIGQIVLVYIFLSDRRRNAWALVGVAIMFAVDFVADIYHRGNGMIAADTRSLVAGGITLGYFTIGSELFVSIGAGVYLATLPAAIRQFKIIFADVTRAIDEQPVQPPPPPKNQSGPQPVRKSRVKQRPKPMRETR